MNLASDRLTSQPNEGLLALQTDQSFDMQELSQLAERFREAHAKLNHIELELHQGLGSGDRLALLRNLEEARMDYSDARFALSTRSIISSRR